MRLSWSWVVLLAGAGLPSAIGRGRTWVFSVRVVAMTACFYRCLYFMLAEYKRMVEVGMLGESEWEVDGQSG